jgi:CrcB protein
MGMTLAFVGLGKLDNNCLRLLITTGFLGGLTTFSAFTGESLNLLQKQEYFWAAIHTSSHVLGALLMAAIGYAVVQNFKA